MNEVIETARVKLKNHRNLYDRSEESVRSQIIQPIMRGLAWDSEDPEEVQLNITTEEGVPDYALLNNGKTVLFLEAKNLSVDIERKEVISQLGKYCFAQGITYGLLTNGSLWILFRAFQAGTILEDRIIWKVDLENDDISTITRRFNTITKSNFDNIEELIKKIHVLDEVWHSTLDEPKDVVAGLIPVVRKSIDEAYPGLSFEDSEIDDYLTERIKELFSPAEEAALPLVETENMRNTIPRWTRMKIGNSGYEVRNSNDVLVNTAEWLIQQRKLTSNVCPIPAGHRRNLVNIEPKHKYGDRFKGPKKLSNGLWIEVNYNTASCVSYSKRLLERFGYRGDMLQLS